MAVLTEGTWVRLRGDDFDVAQVCETFAGAPSIVFTKDDDEQWWMKADAFEGVGDPHELESIATDLIRTINGCAQVLWGNHQPVAADGALAIVDSSGRAAKQVILMGSIKGRSRVGIATVVGGSHPPTPARHIEWVRLALEDPTVSSALRILGEREPTWSELYHLVELIEVGIGRPVSAAGWLSKSERRRFRQTANSRRAIGEQARHGIDFEPPAKPMKLDEARVMAREVTERFLNSLL